MFKYKKGQTTSLTLSCKILFHCYLFEQEQINHSNYILHLKCYSMYNVLTLSLSNKSDMLK